jgi:alpha-N-arabinofuranosidase
VNYQAGAEHLLLRLQGAHVPGKASVTLHTITAAPMNSASLEHPQAIAPVSRNLPYAKDFPVALEAYTVAVIEILVE